MRQRDEVEVLVSGDSEGCVRVAREAARHVVHHEHRQARVAITFLGRARMQRLNASALGHDYPTDVIAFPLPQPDGTVAADIYLCRYVAARNARSHHGSVREEIIRLVVHGVLHVLGWDHPKGAASVRSPMWRRQERYVSQLA